MPARTACPDGRRTGARTRRSPPCASRIRRGTSDASVLADVDSRRRHRSRGTESDGGRAGTGETKGQRHSGSDNVNTVGSPPSAETRNRAPPISAIEEDRAVLVPRPRPRRSPSRQYAHRSAVEIEAFELRNRGEPDGPAIRRPERILGVLGPGQRPRRHAVHRPQPQARLSVGRSHEDKRLAVWRDGQRSRVPCRWHVDLEADFISLDLGLAQRTMRWQPRQLRPRRAALRAHSQPLAGRVHRRRCADRCTARRVAEHFFNLESPVRDVAKPPRRILLQAPTQQRPDGRWCRRWQRPPIRLRLQHIAQHLHGGLAGECRVARSASRRARSRTPRCRYVCRRTFPSPAPGSCRPPCRE